MKQAFSVLKPAPAAQHAVHRRIRERQRGGVFDGERHILEPELARPPTCDLDHLRRDVRRDEPAARQEARQGEEPSVAGPGRELEDCLAGAWVEQLHEPLRHGVRRRPDQLTLTLPAPGDRAPRLDLLARCLYAAAPASSGITSRP